MISLSCFACTKGLQRVVESAINSDSGDFHLNAHIFVVAENRRKNRKMCAPPVHVVHTRF